MKDSWRKWFDCDNCTAQSGVQSNYRGGTTYSCKSSRRKASRFLKVVRYDLASEATR